jgi:zinc transport system substrate-binding protein
VSASQAGGRGFESRFPLQKNKKRDRQLFKNQEAACPFFYGPKSDCIFRKIKLGYWNRFAPASIINPPKLNRPGEVMTRRQTKLLLVLLIMLIYAWACTKPSVESRTDKIKVVASIFPLADFVRNVGGDRVEVVTLLPPAASPHVYSPSPRDLTRMQGAKLFIKIGLGFEFWAEGLVRSGAGRGVTEVDTSRDVDAIREVERGHKHGHEIANPHIWLDPVIAGKQVIRIQEALSQIDSAHGREYEKNAAFYLKQLNALDQEIRDKVGEFKQKAFFSFHPSWTYFARRYGLVEAGVIEKFPGREPSPGEIMELVRKMRATGAKVIFAEPQLNPKAAHVVASEVGARVLVLDPIGSPDHEDRSSYLRLMRHNLSVLQQGMGGL